VTTDQLQFTLVNESEREEKRERDKKLLLHARARLVVTREEKQLKKIETTFSVILIIKKGLKLSTSHFTEMTFVTQK